jgi:subtilisin-like proprotein convertase family protein
MGGFFQRGTWRRALPAVALALLWAGQAWANETILQPTGDVWIRETSPDTTFENDLISVWSNQPDAVTPGRRYGVVEYDLAPLAGKSIVTVEFRIFAMTGGSQAGQPMKQTVYNLPTGATPVTQMTWTVFMAERDAGKTAFETLGRVDLPAINDDPAQQNQYVLTTASAADVQILNSELNGDGKLTVAFIADEDGTSYKRDWGDSGYAPFKPPLLVVDDSDCHILTTSLPETFVGNAYVATLEATGTCVDPEWSIIEGELPAGLELHPTTGIISGTPVLTGESFFTVQMISGETLRTRQFKITVAGDTVVEIPAASDVWIRENSPAVTYENDLVSVWSVQNDPATPGRRYGIIEFDVSSLAGSTLQGAALRLWSTETRAIKQSAFLITSAGTPVSATTWQTYMNEKEGTKQSFSRFGRYELLGSLAGTYLNSSSANQGDVDLIQAEIDGDGKLTLVLAADSDAAYRRDWGDSPVHPPMLALDVGSSCVIVSATLPEAQQGSYYTATLQASSGCGAQPTWQQPDCFPAGLTLDPQTGVISGWPQHRGLHEFVATLVPDGGGATRQADFAINVIGSPADLDNDGDADPDDFSIFNAAYTGPIAPIACELTADDPLPGLAASADVWVRENGGTGHEGDLMSVYSTATGDRRYALVEFDVSSYAGQSLNGAAISLYRYPGFSQQFRPIKQKAYIIDCAAGELAGLTWTSYMADKDAGKVAFEGVGSIEVAALQGLGVYTIGGMATAADLALIQAEANGDGRLSIVFIADEDGTDYRADWGDGNNVAAGYVNQPAMLHLFTDQCGIATMSLPSGMSGSAYSTTLQVTPGCVAGQWRVSQCALPPGLELNANTGEISGVPHGAGTWPFQVQLGTTGPKRNLAISLTADPVADFDQDGDVDLIDFDAFSLAITGLLGPPPLCGTLEFHSTTTPVAVPDGGNVANTITVPAGVTVADVNVFVDVTHGFEGDVKVVLTSPAGTNVTLQDFSGTISTAFSPRTYDDEGAPHPVQPLLNLDGQDAAGTWTLRVYDYDTGFMDFPTLNSWKLIITVP